VLRKDLEVADVSTDSREARSSELRQLETAPVDRPLSLQPLKAQLGSLEFRFVALWMCCTYLRNSFYLSASSVMLEAVGDDNHKYQAFMLGMMPASVVLAVPNTFLIARLGHGNCMHLVTVFSLLHGGLALVPLLPVQFATFTFFTLTKALSYPVLIDYLSHTFGHKTLGSTAGAVLLACGAFNLLVYPSTRLANDVFGGDMRHVLAMMLGLFVPLQTVCARRLQLLRLQPARVPSQTRTSMVSVPSQPRVELHGPSIRPAIGGSDMPHPLGVSQISMQQVVSA